jgi:hypothetical protein
MKISVRGWARNMGTQVLTEYDLAEIEYSRDFQRGVWRGKPKIFTAVGRTFVAWCQHLRHMGDYRMELELSNEDLLRLFKVRFGTELSEWLIDQQGFTLSPELIKRALRTVKLTDVTLADLVRMVSGVAPQDQKIPAQQEPPTESRNLQ